MRHGFSLVELSIVLVILGLLTGGILAGQSLIRAAEMRSVGSDMARYKAAAMSFRDKYFAAPGDMNNATKFWGEAAAAGAACKAASSSGLPTCDGDGDGALNIWPVGSNEIFRFWQHLANAGLIEGTYTGVAFSADDRHARIGTNVPRSRVSTAGFYIRYYGTVDASDTFWWAGTLGTAMQVGAENTTVSLETPFLKAEEAWNIDTKLDDGKPSIGAVRDMKSYTTCHTTQVQATSEYALSTSGITCQLVYYNFI